RQVGHRRVHAFQRRRDVDADGVLGHLALTLDEEGAAAPVLRRGSARTASPALLRNWRAMVAGSAPAPAAPPPLDAAAAASSQDAVKVYGAGDAAVRALEGVSVAFLRGHFTAI